MCGSEAFRSGIPFSDHPSRPCVSEDLITAVMPTQPHFGAYLQHSVSAGIPMSCVQDSTALHGPCVGLPPAELHAAACRMLLNQAHPPDARRGWDGQGGGRAGRSGGATPLLPLQWFPAVAGQAGRGGGGQYGGPFQGPARGTASRAFGPFPAPSDIPTSAGGTSQGGCGGASGGRDFYSAIGGGFGGVRGDRDSFLSFGYSCGPEGGGGGGGADPGGPGPGPVPAGGVFVAGGAARGGLGLPTRPVCGAPAPLGAIPWGTAWQSIPGGLGPAHPLAWPGGTGAGTAGLGGIQPFEAAAAAAGGGTLGMMGAPNSPAGFFWAGSNPWAAAHLQRPPAAAGSVVAPQAPSVYASSPSPWSRVFEAGRGADAGAGATPRGGCHPSLRGGGPPALVAAASGPASTLSGGLALVRQADQQLSSADGGAGGVEGDGAIDGS